MTEDYLEILQEAMDSARVDAASRAGFSPEDITKLPQATLVSISKNGEVVISFSKEIDFPQEILEPRKLDSPT